MAQFETSGAQPQKAPKSAPIHMDRILTGIYTQRNPLHDAGSVYEARYIGGKADALWLGSNVELTNEQTLKRRPGLSSFSTATYPTPPDRTFSFELLNGTIQVIVDTGSTGSLVLSSVASSSGGSAVYTGTITGGGSNAYAGLVFLVSGFSNSSNNGTYVCTASSTTTLTLSNATAIAESIAATAVSTGAVYVDNQDGSKTFLFAKSPDAGQGYFVAVGGVLYYGDGVDTKKYTPGNANGTIWNWQSFGPAKQPSVVIVESGVASVQWVANTFWSTMGLVFDTTTSTVFQLQSVNASTTNTTQNGTSGNGQPAWNQTPGGTTTDNTITWTNFGPIVAWTAHTVYNNGGVGGTATNPCIIYDPVTKACYENANPGFAQGTSGGVYPTFKAGLGQSTQDGSVKWFYLGTPGTPSPWVPSHVYPKFGSVSNNSAVSSIVEPVGLQNGLPTNQTVYWQTSSGGTSGAGGSTPFVVGSVVAGTLTQDNDLIWLSLGSFTWQATHSYSGWLTNGAIFSAIKDTNGNFQVCTTTGTSATVEPGTVSTLSAAANASGGNTTYTGTFAATLPVGNGKLAVVISGFTNAANNGTFTLVSSTPTTITVNNPSGVAETHAGSVIFNPWGVGYGGTTSDGTAVWTCVGIASPWTVNTKWFLPTNGFSPPTAASPFGGASVIDSNSDVEFIINSGLGGGSQPTWNAIGSYTDDNGTSLILTSVSVSGGIATYNGTITGGGANAFAGQAFLISGFTNAGNNVLINVLTSSATILTCTQTSQVNETHAGAAQNGAIWFNLEAFSPNSLAWQFGLAYAYSFKARALTDFYSVNVPGTNQPPIPPGLTSPLSAPTGSETGAITTASPAFQIVGSNVGAVNTVSGVGSTDPQYDTIVIWRSADSASGAADMFELTEIPAPPPIGGIAQPWSFKDFLPSTPTSLFPGLNILIPAPIDHQNDPPPTNFLPMVYNFQRIWGAAGNQIFFSGGPDVLAGESNEAFNPSDEFPFLSTVVRLVKNSQGITVFLTDSIEAVLGGPLTASFYSVPVAPGVGLLSFNALDVFGGEVYFFTADRKLRIMSPTLNIGDTGFALGDQFANMPISGHSDANWDPSKVYVAMYQNGLDSCVIVADGSTGWYRLNPQQVNGSLQGGTAAIWSPFANITNGCKMVQSIETAPGIKNLLVGATTGGHKILKRDLTVYTDDGTPYDANFVMGSIVLAKPGQRGLLEFIEADFAGVNYRPVISFLLNEISGTFTPFLAPPQFDPPSIYGQTITPTSYSPNRYYFAGTGKLAVCRHLQIKFDLGTTSNPDEMFNMTIFGRLVVE